MLVTLSAVVACIAVAAFSVLLLVRESRKSSSTPKSIIGDRVVRFVIDGKNYQVSCNKYEQAMESRPEGSDVKSLLTALGLPEMNPIALAQIMSHMQSESVLWMEDVKKNVPPLSPLGCALASPTIRPLGGPVESSQKSSASSPASPAIPSSPQLVS